jgi:hypothetical protein
VLEAQRTTLYASAVLALLLLARGRLLSVVVGAWASAAAVGTYALATRLLPDLVGGTSTDRLARPIGYWNGLGLLAAVGIALAVGIVAETDARGIRVAAAASVPVLICTVYFTFSRGAWFALAVAVAVALALDPRRLSTAAAAVALVPIAVAAIAAASHEGALNQGSGPSTRAVDQGHALAIVIAVLAGISGVGEAAFGTRLRSLAHGLRVSRAMRVSLLVAVAASAAATVAWFAASGSLGRTYDAFRSSKQEPTGSLGARLFSASGNSRLDYWRVAWKEYSQHPLLGSGAGTFELYWTRDRPVAVGSRFAHSLYLQELAELGPMGLLLLGLTLGIPLAAVRSARHTALVPAAGGAYVAVFAHAALDWDWQLPAVMLAGILLGTVCLRAVSGAGRRPPLTPRGRLAFVALVVALGAFAGTGWIGNRALARAAAALSQRDYRAVIRDARAARSWQPWASEPWRELGLAELSLGDTGAARASFRHAISLDRLDWQTWLDLAAASGGAERAQALQESLRLNPLSPQVRALAPAP